MLDREKNTLLAPCFWGALDPNAMLQALVDTVAPLSGGAGVYAGDNLLVAGRNLSFLLDERFLAAYQGVISEDNHVGYAIMWRIHVFCWAAQNGLRREGDFVECGVASGALSEIMIRYLDFDTTDKHLHLFDAWDTDARVDASVYGGNSLAEVTARFALWPNVLLKPGFIPDSLAGSAAPERIAFLHIDLNSATAEIAALDQLFDRVSPGAVILLDDYGHMGYRESQRAQSAWFAKRGYKIAELPTGQGLIIK